MQLTHKQFYNYIKENGVTKAELTEGLETWFCYFDKGDSFLFAVRLEELYGRTKEGILIDFDKYKGKFKIIQEVAMDKSKIIAQIKKKNKELNKLIEML